MPETVFSLLDPRSFSSLWYWIMVGLVWTRVMNHPLGVPVDLVRDAQAGNALASTQVRQLTQISILRRDQVAASLGFWRTATWSFALTFLALLAFWYRIELAQALFLLAAPLCLAGFLTDRAAAFIKRDTLTEEGLNAALLRLKLWVQVIGLTSVFVTAVWGMLYTLASRAL